MPSLFFCQLVSADSVILKTGKELKGLVVEQHADRIVLSTEHGEVPILLSGIKEVKYDDPEQNFFQAGKSYEGQNKLGEALAYYEKALEVNPNFEEAKKASIGVRNRFWARSTEGPLKEIEKQQVLYDAWDKRQTPEDQTRAEAVEDVKALRERLGMTLSEKGDWIIVEYVESKKNAGVAGVRKNDRLVSMDGESLRYLSPEVVRSKMLVPRHANFMLEIERDCFIHKNAEKTRLKKLGIKLKLEYKGVVLTSVEQGSLAEQAGLKEEDLLVRVDGVSTRYMPMKQLVKLIEGSPADRVVFTVRRSALLTRG